MGLFVYTSRKNSSQTITFVALSHAGCVRNCYNQIMLEKIVEFARDVGDYARANQQNVNFADSHMKSAQNWDVVTETDFEISRRFGEFVTSNFAHLDYIIVDEESVADLGDKPMEKIKSHEYVFVIDPIDGTLTYSHGLPFYGVSIGVFKNQKAILSAIYAPSMDVLVYGDESGCFMEESGVKKKLNAPTTTAPLFTNKETTTNFDQQRQMNLMPLDVYSAALTATYISLGKLRGWVFRASLWDIAGASYLLKNAGFEIFDPSNSQPINLFDETLFGSDLRMKDPKIVCTPKQYADFTKLFNL